MNVPQIPLVQPVPAVIPEIPIAKRKDQRGVAKLAIFAYHRQTGAPVWQSGLVKQESSANNVWILARDPFSAERFTRPLSSQGTRLVLSPQKRGSVRDVFRPSI